MMTDTGRPQFNLTKIASKEAEIEKYSSFWKVPTEGWVISYTLECGGCNFGQRDLSLNTADRLRTKLQKDIFMHNCN